MTENTTNLHPEWEDPTPKQKAKSKGPMIGLISVALIAVLGIGLYASGLFGKLFVNKEDRVTQALYSLMKGEENPFVQDWMGTKELNAAMAKAYRSSGTLELVEAPIVQEMIGFPVPGGITLSFEAQQDTALKTMSAKLGLGMMGTDLVNGQLYVDENKMQVAAPSLFKEVISADFSGDLDSKLDNAPLFKDQPEAEEFKESIRQFAQTLKDSQGQTTQLVKLMTGEASLYDYQGLKDATEKFKGQWVIEDAPAKTASYNGKQAAFDGYKVTMPKAAYVAFLKEMKTFMLSDAKFKTDIMDLVADQVAAGELITKEEAYTKMGTEMDQWIQSVEQNAELKDIPFTIHMSDDNELVSLVSEVKSAADGFNLNLERSGGAYGNENMKLTLVATGTNAGQMELVSIGKTEGAAQSRELHISAASADAKAADNVIKWNINKESGALSGEAKTSVVEADQVVPIEMTFKGKVQDIVKGKSGTAVLDEIKINANGQAVATLKGDMKYSVEGVKAVMPEGTTMDLFTATQADMDKIMEQIQEKLGGFLNLMDTPLGF